MAAERERERQRKLQLQQNNKSEDQCSGDEKSEEGAAADSAVTATAAGEATAGAVAASAVAESAIGGTTSSVLVEEKRTTKTNAETQTALRGVSLSMGVLTEATVAAAAAAGNSEAAALKSSGGTATDLATVTVTKILEDIKQEEKGSSGGKLASTTIFFTECELDSTAVAASPSQGRAAAETEIPIFGSEVQNKSDSSSPCDLGISSNNTIETASKDKSEKEEEGAAVSSGSAAGIPRNQQGSTKNANQNTQTG